MPVHELIQAQLPSLYRMAWALLPEEAEDLAHDTLVAALSSWGALRQPAKLRAWLATILANNFRKRLRSREVRKRHQTQLPAPGVEVRTPVSAACLSELQQAVGKALQALPAEERLLVVLSVYQEHNSSEIGAMLGMPAGTVRARLHAARKSLRGLLLEKEL